MTQKEQKCPTLADAQAIVIDALPNEKWRIQRILTTGKETARAIEVPRVSVPVNNLKNVDYLAVWVYRSETCNLRFIGFYLAEHGKQSASVGNWPWVSLYWDKFIKELPSVQVRSSFSFYFLCFFAKKGRQEANNQCRRSAAQEGARGTDCAARMDIVRHAARHSSAHRGTM